MAKVLALGVAAPWEGILQVISTAATDMGRGELRQILEDADKKISVDAYFQIIQGKTAGLFRVAAELGGLVAQASVERRNRLCRLGEAFGMAFQIRDDILDFAGHAGHMGKPVGQDISNGKMTLPLLLAMEGIAEEEKQRVLQKLSKDSKADAEWIGRFVKEHHGIERADEKARMFAKEAEEILATFNASVYRTAWEELVTHELERSG
jgi:octaprenyl-diphosphate synthase